MQNGLVVQLGNKELCRAADVANNSNWYDTIVAVQ